MFYSEISSESLAYTKLEIPEILALKDWLQVAAIIFYYTLAVSGHQKIYTNFSVFLPSSNS